MPNLGRREPFAPIGPAHDPQSLYRQMKDYLEWLAEKNYSPRSVLTWERYLRYFVTWCDERGLTRPNEITRPILERYQRHLFLKRKANGAPLSATHQAGQTVPVQKWFRWLTRNNRLLYNPAADLDLPRKEERLPKYVPTPGEMERVLGMPNLDTPTGVRDRAILETLYSTGMRRMEVIGLQQREVDYERGTVMIRQGKGRKDRMVPIGERALAWIAKYRDEVRPELALAGDDGTLFLTVAGESFSDNRMTRMVRDYVHAAGLGPIGSCHMFRHAMATQMLENGADVRYIQAMLGHADIKTTQVYTRVSIRALKEIHTATHPARLGRTTQNQTSHEDGPPAMAADLLVALDDEAEEERGGVDGCVRLRARKPAQAYPALENKLC